eukprot:GHVU01084279.1.p1 GENE.GHVU01084279.1~~GHVU01084279.1.p1  ORF type:complete len:125 (+),score=8.85 GHVU01084279.1:89-463(+)
MHYSVSTSPLALSLAHILARSLASGFAYVLTPSLSPSLREGEKGRGGEGEKGRRGETRREGEGDMLRRREGERDRGIEEWGLAGVLSGKFMHGGHVSRVYGQRGPPRRRRSSHHSTGSVFRSVA